MCFGRYWCVLGCFSGLLWVLMGFCMFCEFAVDSAVFLWLSLLFG